MDSKNWPSGLRYDDPDSQLAKVGADETVTDGGTVAQEADFRRYARACTGHAAEPK
jgi:hypothetical protein